MFFTRSVIRCSKAVVLYERIGRGGTTNILSLVISAILAVPTHYVPRSRLPFRRLANPRGRCDP
jgi:hypothetical protein